VALGEVAKLAAPGERSAVVVTAVRQGLKMRRLVLVDFDQFADLVSTKLGTMDVAEVDLRTQEV